jgi:hypothetical protein
MHKEYVFSGEGEEEDRKSVPVGAMLDSMQCKPVEIAGTFTCRPKRRITHVMKHLLYVILYL